MRHLILPTIVLGTIPPAVIDRQTRSAILEVLGEDYIRTARPKGLGSDRINGIHALCTALIPVITVIGLSVGTLRAGAILTDAIFSWPGIGKGMVDGIFRREDPVVQGAVADCGRGHGGEPDRRCPRWRHQPQDQKALTVGRRRRPRQARAPEPPA